MDIIINGNIKVSETASGYSIKVLDGNITDMEYINVSSNDLNNRLYQIMKENNHVCQLNKPQAENLILWFIELIN